LYISDIGAMEQVELPWQLVCKRSILVKQDNKFKTSLDYFYFSLLEFSSVYSNIHIYPKRCNVTQLILSGNCSTCFGWYHHPSSERKQMYLQRL